ncbi:MAG: ribbon-helix-helix protein, CopG family [Leptolyngbyaceae cyanobacterium MO_188.B28]|nr:ribbon-helix-helix protein, CopG family [Leptolyngbyaceae cyanobacterium MO_188.B28]
MKSDFTITLDSELKAALEAAAIAAGQSAENLMHQAIKDYLFTRQFRTLRAYLIEKPQGAYTDEDIFEMVS